MPGVEKLFSFQAHGQIKQPGKHRTHIFRPVADYLSHQSCKLCIVWFPHFVTSMLIWSLSWNNKITDHPTGACPGGAQSTNSKGISRRQVTGKNRLSKPKQDRLQEYFVAGTTARCAASLVGVNFKTGAYYFHRLREIIAYHLEQEADTVFSGEIEVDESYFGGRR
jgi:hypothetical protein